ncbi:unnamed protein product [Discosporangium mesarthrocarpum]
MANAITKQDYLTVKLDKQRLEKKEETMRLDFARVEAMNAMLQAEIDRLQRLSPEAGERVNKSWKRWLPNTEPASLEPTPIKVWKRVRTLDFVLRGRGSIGDKLLAVHEKRQKNRRKTREARDNPPPSRALLGAHHIPREQQGQFVAGNGF